MLALITGNKGGENMSLELSGAFPDGLTIKTGFDGQTIYLGDYEISMKDFCEAMLYVLENTDLEPDDPRLEFVELVKSMRQVEGYNLGARRLESVAID